MQSEADASVFRRRFVPELLMALHDSPLADGGASRALALRVLCCAAAVPSLAGQLASYSGEARSSRAGQVRPRTRALHRHPMLRQSLSSCNIAGGTAELVSVGLITASSDRMAAEKSVARPAWYSIIASVDSGPTCIAAQKCVSISPGDCRADSMAGGGGVPFLGSSG